MNRNKCIHYVILILIAIGAAALVMLFLRFRNEKSSIYNRTLIAGRLSIPVSIASTPAEQQQGLSDTPSLPENAGKLFVFNQPGNYGFWMKDMNYGLDFVWINNDLKIVSITPDVAAATYPQVFYPPQPVQYVLEVNAGFSAKNNLTVGEQMSL